MEIKSVSTAQSIIDQVRKASKQIGVDGILLIDASESKLNNHDILHNSIVMANYYNLRAFFAMTSSSECFYQIKKGDSVTAAKRGHDPKSPCVPILPNPERKVKPLARYLLLHFASTWDILILGNIYK